MLLPAQRRDSNRVSLISTLPLPFFAPVFSDLLLFCFENPLAFPLPPKKQNKCVGQQQQSAVKMVCSTENCNEDTANNASNKT